MLSFGKTVFDIYHFCKAVYRTANICAVIDQSMSGFACAAHLVLKSALNISTLQLILGQNPSVTPFHRVRDLLQKLNRSSTNVKKVECFFAAFAAFISTIFNLGYIQQKESPSQVNLSA